MSSVDAGGPDALQRIVEQLEARLAAHRVEVRAALADHLARSAERERAIASALDGLTGQLNQFTATLAAEVRRAGDATVAQAVAELGTAARALEAASVDAVAEAVARVDARVAQLATTVGPTLRELAAARTTDDAVEELRRLRVSVESLAGSDVGGDALAHVVSELHELRDAVEGLAATGAEPVDLPAALERALQALDALDTLAMRPDPAPTIARLVEVVEGAAGRPGGGVTRAELDAALAELQGALLDAPAPASPDDVSAVGEQLAGIRATLERLAAAPPAPDTTALAGDLAAIRSALERLAATPPAGDARPVAELQAALADRLGALDAIRAGVDQLVAWPAATGEEVDRLAARIGDLEAVASRLGAAAGDPAPSAAASADLDAVRRQLDAIGRLVHLAVRALHLVEAATVGVSPRTEADREAAAAALTELQAPSEGMA